MVKIKQFLFAKFSNIQKAMTSVIVYPKRD